MNKLVFLFSIFLLSSIGYGQKYGNEWIKYNQRYYSIKITQTGLYKIDYATLAASGIPVNTIKSSNLQLFGKERQVALYVVDSNNVLDANDAIYFYAEKNDGWLDSTIYQVPTDIANPGFSLYNDTLQYFLTWNSLTTNLRYKNDVDTNFTGLGNPTTHILRSFSSTARDSYNEGVFEGHAQSSFFSPAEGWGFPSQQVTKQSGPSVIDYPVPINTPNYYPNPTAPLPKVHVISSTNSNASYVGSANHHLRIAIGKYDYELTRKTMAGYQMTKFDAYVPHPQFDTVSGFTNLHFQIYNNLGVEIDKQTLHYWSIIYPAKPLSINNTLDRFYVPNSTAAKRILAFEGFTGETPIVLYKGADYRSLTYKKENGTLKMVIPKNTSDSVSLIMVTTLSSATKIVQLSPVNGTGTFNDFSKLNLESAYLIIYHPKLTTGTSAYAAYRSSVTGGSRNIILANIEELYLQFGGGVDKHINSIRRFSHFVYKKSTKKPVGLFLIGKGLKEYNYTRFNVSDYKYSLIPSFGNPSSDVAITAGLEGTKWEPLIPTGRFSCTTNEEILLYLDKVIEYEEKQDQTSVYNSSTKDWQKQILHFVGGSGYYQQSTYQGYMNDMKKVAEDSLYAGNVTSFFKPELNPLNPAQVDNITERIASGASLMTFFSHASPNGGFEINVDDPTTWNNKGKYPIIIGISCFSGDVFKTGTTFSENMVRLKDEGAIAFLSPSLTGYDTPLYNYSLKLYEHFSKLSYGLTFGEQIKRTIRDVQKPTSGSPILEATSLQMIFLGDPLLRLNWHKNPEIELLSENVYFEPKDINLGVDSITLKLIVKNLGKAITKNYSFEVIRDFPNSSIDSIYHFSVKGLNYIDTVSFKIALQPEIAVGINNFKISVDIPSYYPEQYDEINNNQVTKTLNIHVDGIQPIYPTDFAVVPYDTLTVYASTISPNVPLKTYLFELDTSPFYNSPQHRKFSTTGLGGIKSVKPNEWKSASGNNFPLKLTDSTVYYWKVALDSSVIVWNEFSFQYIPNKSGWGQDDFYQFKKNAFANVNLNETAKIREFPIASPHTIYLKAFPDNSTNSEWGIDGGRLDYAHLLGGPDIYVGVIDPVTLRPWQTAYDGENLQNDFGNYNQYGVGRKRSMAYFAFKQDNPAQLASFENMIRNKIPAGHYVAIYTTIATSYTNWTNLHPSLYQLFKDIGSKKVHTGQPELPFGMIFTKGDTTSIVEKHWPETAYPAYPHIFVEYPIIESIYRGYETTPFIGPSKNWGTAFWKRDSLELQAVDSVRITIEAYNSEKAQLDEIDAIFRPNDSVINLNALIPAATYPYIRLKAFYQDESFFTPAQVDRLHVLYQPVPEAAIDGKNIYISNSALDTLLDGQTFKVAVDIRNISPYAMDSLLVNYWVEDQNRIRHPIPYPRQDSLLVGGLLRDTISVSTLGLNGVNSLWIEVNPYIGNSTIETDQPEQYHFNNLLQIPFIVDGDNENPILDVTFNGRHILNKDIVDPESEIVITLKDENPYLIMDSDRDTASFGIYLTNPAGVQRRIPFLDGSGRPVMQWIPANAGNKKFKIIFPKSFEQDGMYRLDVQGTDKSGNISGDYAYRVDFEIIRESSITYLMNYPNPFSTKTQFVFTLTGSDEPDQVIIQIMTVSGRVIREITEDELGPIHIGRNITTYAWDGKDEFGSPLANGVYLYTVKAQIGGKDIKHRSSDADNYFKKEFGKMYLMR